MLLTGGAVAYTTVFTAGSGTTYETGSGLNVTVATDHGLDLINPFNGTDTVYIDNFSVTASGPAAVTIDQFSGSTTDLSDIDATSNAIEVDPSDKPHVDITGGITDLSYSTTTLQNDAIAFTYSASASGSVTINGLAATTDWTAATSAGSLVDTGTTDGSGAATVDVGTATNTDVILFTNHAPQAANLSPADGAALTQRQTTFSIDVTDQEFGTAQGDSVTAELFVDGSSVGSQTVTSNQTVSIQHTVSTGGDHTYHWELTDNYGQTTTTNQRTVSVPNELEIRKELAPTELVDNTSVTIQFYGDTLSDTPILVTRNTSDGTLNMTGLPAGQPLILTADADGYLNRRIFIQSLYQTQTVYLLNDTAQHTDVIFEIEDYTGTYPQGSTVLQVQRALNGSWQTVMGDYFGANGQFPAQLAYNVRHRLVLTNINTGDSQILGTYTPLTDAQETVVVSPSGDIDSIDAGVVTSLQPAARALPARSGIPVSASLSTGSNTSISQWSATWYYVNGSTNTTLDTQSLGGDGALKSSLDLSGRAGGTVRIHVQYTLSNGDTNSQWTSYPVTRTYTNQATLVDAAAAFVGLAPPSNQGSVMTFLSMTLTVVGTGAVASKFRISTEWVGLIAIMFVTGFAIMGWVRYNLVFSIVVVWLSIAFLRRRY